MEKAWNQALKTEIPGGEWASIRQGTERLSLNVTFFLPLLEVP